VTSDGSTWSSAAFTDASIRQAAASPTALFTHGFDDQLHRSTDGGATWSRRGPVDASGLAFLTADVGLAANGFGVYRTEDGGQTWTRRYPYAAYAVAAVPGGAGAVAVTLEGAVLRSADAGATWAAVLSTAETLETVTCPSATRCLAGGTGGLLLVSDDAGATWSPRATGLTEAILSLAFGDDLHGLAQVSTSDGNRGLYRSADGGSTWEPVTMEPVNALAAAGPAAGLVVGVSGLLSRTDDGGATWTQVGDRHLVAGGAVRVVSPGVVLAAGLTGARRSADGGATWSAVAYPAEVAWASGARMAFANGRLGLLPAVERASGTERLLRTLDGGATWSLEGAAPLPTRVSDLACLPGDGEPATITCHAAAGGVLYRTLDGGATWAPLAAAGEGISRVRFLDPVHGFVTRSDPTAPQPSTGRLYATADGGATWTVVADAMAGALEVVAPATVVSGRDVSVDGGATWTRWASVPAGRSLAVGAGLVVAYEPVGFSVAAPAQGGAALQEGAFPWEGPMVSLAVADADRWFGVDLNGVLWVSDTAGR
jgi:photosystem II stability/assembly factor-like uncharacterized protein